MKGTRWHTVISSRDSGIARWLFHWCWRCSTGSVRCSCTAEYWAGKAVQQLITPVCCWIISLFNDFCCFQSMSLLHVAINVYINYRFLNIYICCFITAEVCNLCIVVLGILATWKITWKWHYFYFSQKTVVMVILINVNLLIKKNMFCGT